MKNLNQIRRKPEPVRTFRDGREVCNLNTKAGQDEYARRKLLMWERQKGICPLCKLPLPKKLMTFDHEVPRGMGAGRRDDRITVEMDGAMVWQNAAVHLLCNSQKGSRRIVDFLDVP